MVINLILVFCILLLKLILKFNLYCSFEINHKEPLALYSSCLQQSFLNLKLYVQLGQIDNMDIYSFSSANQFVK